MTTYEPTSQQIDEFRSRIALGLLALKKPEPMTAAEWADEFFYLSSESSYHEGKWQTLGFQIAILNSMGNDEIRIINVIKSARLGYTKMLLAAIGYLLEHKKRNILTFSPTDSDAESFMKTHLQTMVRDVPPVLDLAPWHGKKHPDNTLNAKRFANGKQVFVHGGKAARNYREKSVDAVIYDELAAFDEDIEKEGSPTTLGDKRLEGSTFPKSVRGSTPKERGMCQITTAAEDSPHLLKYHVNCPCCGEPQTLKWGGPDCAFGIKWDEGKPETAFYLCEHNGCVIKQHELKPEGEWICENTGIRTKDGIDWFSAEGEIIKTPKSISFHVWTAYSPFTTWEQIVCDFLNAKGNKSKLKTFVNTTLGETWEDDEGQKTDWQQLYLRREIYAPRHHVPERGLILFGFIDTQDDRYEGRVWAFGAGEETWLIDKWVLTGMPDSPELLQQVSEKIHRQYTRTDGQILPVIKWGWDSGGHYTDEVYQQAKRHGIQWVIPTKGASTYGKPIANWPKKKNPKGVYLLEIGTDNAKELIYSRLQIQPSARDHVPGCIHLPADDLICDEAEIKQLTAETKQIRILNGRKVYRWDAGGRRNEGLDCLVGVFAMLRISQQRFGLDLQLLADQAANKAPEAPPTPKTKKRRVVRARI